MSDAIQIRDLIRSINGREDLISELSKRTADSAAEWLKEAALQGSELIKLKSSLKHGEWLPLFDNGTIQISVKTASNRMRLASNWQHVADLGITSLRKALSWLTDTQESPIEVETKQRTEYQEAIWRVSRGVGFIEKHDMHKWPPSAWDRLRELFLPTASKLWPSKFQ